MASPSGLEATASDSKANVLFGRASKQRTTRLPKWRSLRIVGTVPSHAGVGCVAASAIAAPAAAQNTIKIGVPMPLSGPAALYGEPAVKGMRMFVEEVNAAGGVLGKKLELVVRDSKAS